MADRRVGADDAIVADGHALADPHIAFDLGIRPDAGAATAPRARADLRSCADGRRERNLRARMYAFDKGDRWIKQMADLREGEPRIAHQHEPAAIVRMFAERAIGDDDARMTVG